MAVAHQPEPHPNEVLQARIDRLLREMRALKRLTRFIDPSAHMFPADQYELERTMEQVNATLVEAEGWNR